MQEPTIRQVEMTTLPPVHFSFEPDHRAVAKEVEVRTHSDTEEPIDDLVGRLGTLAKDASVEHAIEIGRLVIEELYAGDLHAWRSRGPKAHSLRELSRRSDLPLSSSALYRSIALYELSEALGGVQAWSGKGLGISHMRLVLGLPREAQRELLDRAAKERWTVAELERETVAIRSGQPRRRARGGRPRLPRFVKSLNRMRKCADATDDFFGDVEAAGDMEPERVAELREQLAHIRSCCEELERRLASASL